MTAYRDSFFAIWALAPVTSHFAAGDGIVVLTPSLDRVIWANAAGAALLGYGNVAEVLGADPRLGVATRRQITSTPGYPKIGQDRTITVRLASGMTSRMVAFSASDVTLPDGGAAILLAAPASQRRSPGEMATLALATAEQAGAAEAAILDDSGKVLAATGAFHRLAIETAALETAAAGASQDGTVVGRIVTVAGPRAMRVMGLGADGVATLMVVTDEPVEADVAAPVTPTTEGQDADAGLIAETETMVGLMPEAPAEPAQQSGAAGSHDEEPTAEPETSRPEMAAAVAREAQTSEPDAEHGEAEALVSSVAETDRAAHQTPDDAARPEDGSGAHEPPAPAETSALAESPAHDAIVDLDTSASLPDAEAVLPGAAERAEPAPEDHAQPPAEIEHSVERTDGDSVANDDARAELVGGQPEGSAADAKPTAGEAGAAPQAQPEGDLDAVLNAAAETIRAAIAEADGSVADIAVGEAVDQAADAANAAAAIDRSAPPVRFVWKTDADGRFSEISAELATVVGAANADLIGLGFRAAAARLGIDGSGEIAGLLERHDTWSGRMVLWPVAGTSLRVPVDLAALPTYGRDRAFAGFRGFGVARPADAIVDTRAAEPESGGIPRTDDEGDVSAEDPFRGETPAIEIAARQERRDSDKVIRLAEHRQPVIDKSLSAGERSAFREIGDRLKKDNGAAPTLRADNDIVSPAEYSGRTPPPQPEGDDRPQPLATEEPDAAAPLEETGTELAEPDDIAVYPKASDQTVIAVPAGMDAAPRREVSEEREPVEPAKSRTEPAHTFLPSAFATGATDERPAIDTSILDQLPVPVLIHSGDLLHYANREFLELTGYGGVADLAQAGGLDALFGEPYPPEDGAPDPARKLRLHTREGLEIPVEAFLQSVPWGEGKALLLSLRRSWRQPVSYPVSEPPTIVERKVADPETEARIAEMRAIVDTATDGVVLIAPDGTIRSISRPAEALFGFDSEDVTGKPFTSLFAIESQRAARDYLNGLSEHGVASVLNDGREVIGREAQGRFIPLFMTIGRLPDDSGFCAVVRDITQWKRAEEELTEARAQAERASSQKTDFLARVSHEIRTPLNAIIGFSELMLDEKFGPIGSDRYRDYLRDINRSGNHVLDLVNDLLDISKIEAGQQEMSYEAVSLNDTLAETVAMMQPAANRERVIIRSSFASRLPEVVADLRSIRQIALNLLANAIRYTPAGGQVIVSTAYEPSGDVVMRVRDTGIGMSHAEIEQALKPFKQINALKRARGDGTGLGLPLTKAMVEANRARFIINSTPGEGTLVEVTFPSTRVLAD